MKTVRVERLKEGDILAKPIMDAFGRVLLQKDVIFTRRIIQRLADFNFKYVYIHDPLTDDLYPNELLDDQLRLETVQHLDRKSVV